MECAEVRDALARGEQPTGRRFEAHLRDCPGCTELCNDHALLGLELAELRAAEREISPALSNELKNTLRSLEADLEKERGPAAWLSSQSTPLRMLFALGAALLVGGLIFVFKRRVDFELYPLARLAAAVGAYALVIGAATRVALRPLQLEPLPVAYRTLVMVMAVVIPFAIAAAPAAHFAHAASLAGAGPDLGARALECFLFGSVLALPGLLLLWALDRGRHRSLIAAVASAGASGLIGILALELHCPITHPAHLVAGHATVGAVLVLAYALVTWIRGRVVSAREAHV